MYDVYTWPKILRNGFEFKHSLFDGTNIVKHSDEKKSGCIVAMDYWWIHEMKFSGLWNFGNDFARKVLTFSVNNSSSTHANNRKNDLVLGEGPTYGINGRPWCTRKNV